MIIQYILVVQYEKDLFTNAELDSAMFLHAHRYLKVIIVIVIIIIITIIIIVIIIIIITTITIIIALYPDNFNCQGK